MSLKILYIYLDGDMSSNASGVQKKILAKISAINSLGVSCDGLSVSNAITNEVIYEKNYKLIPYSHTETKYFNHTKRELAKFKALGKYIEVHNTEYDFIIFRYPLASLGLFSLVKKFPKKIIFEHNTKEIEELELICEQRKKKIPKIFRPWYIIYRFEMGTLPILIEKHLGRFILKYARMGVAVTNEIVDYEKSRSSNYKVKLLTNGIDVSNCQLRQFLDFDKKTLRLFMLIGHDAEWHGVDRLIHSLSKYRGDIKIEIDFYGSINQKNIELANHYMLNSNIKFKKSIPYGELDLSLDYYHMGIGAFGAKRKGLMEGTSLKVREYLARGFGFIFAYNDTDMSAHKEFSPYCFSFPNDESLIDFNDVIIFANKLYKDKSHHLKIRDLAEQFLDTKVKMRQLIDYIKEEEGLNEV